MGHDGTQWANGVVSLHGGYQSIIRLSWLRKQDGAQRGPQIEVHSPVLYQVLDRSSKRANGREEGTVWFHFHADGRFIDRPTIAFFLRNNLLFIRLHFKTSSLIYLLCDIGGCYFRPADETNGRHGSTHTNDILNFPSSQAFKRFLCLEHRTRGGILRKNPAFVSDPFQGTTERSGCPGISKMESTPYMYVTAFCIVHACLFSPVAVTCISPKWSMQQPSPNHRKHCFML